MQAESGESDDMSKLLIRRTFSLVREDKPLRFVSVELSDRSSSDKDDSDESPDRSVITLLTNQEQIGCSIPKERIPTRYCSATGPAL